MKRISILLSLLLVFSFVLAACAEPAEEGVDGVATEPVLGETPGIIDETEVVEPTEVIEPTATIAPTATEAATPTVVETEAVTPTQPVETGALNPMRASVLLGANIQGAAGENVGEVNSLIVDNQTGQILYAVVDPSAEAGVEDGLVAIPWEAMQVTDAPEDDVDVVTFTSDIALLSTAPTFADETAFDFADPAWDDELVNSWSGEVATLPNTGEAEMGNLLHLQDVTDYQLLNAAGEDLGDVEDMIVSPEEGTIPYVIVGTGGILDLGEELRPVPFESLSWNAEQEAFVLDVDQATLENAPVVDLDNLPDTADEGWDEEWQTFWADPEAAAEDGAAAEADTTDLSRLSNLIGYNVTGTANEAIGEVDSVLVDTATDQIQYVLVDAEDDLVGDAEGLTAIPWQAFQVNAGAGEEADSLIFNQDTAVLAEVPALNVDDDAFDINAATWDDELFGFWGNQVSGLSDFQGVEAADAEASVVRLHDPSDHQLVDANGEDIGDVEDVIMDPTTGTLTHALWAAGGFLDIGEEIIPVPFERIIFAVEDEPGLEPSAYVLNVDAAAVEEAPRFASMDELPDVTQEGWDAEIVEFWQGVPDQ